MLYIMYMVECAISGVGPKNVNAPCAFSFSAPADNPLQNVKLTLAFSPFSLQL